MTTHILLVRHGQTEFNLKGIYQGQADSPLTQQGEDQARALAPRIAELATCDQLYCSDLQRTRRTAELVAPQHTLVDHVGLRERNFGIFQELPKEEIGQRFPEEWAAHNTHDPDWVVPGGESNRQMLQRVTLAIDEIADRHAGQRIVIVSHGGAIGIWIKSVLGLPLDAPRRYDVGNTSLSIAYQEQDHWMIRTLGEMAHCDGLQDLSVQAEG